MFVSNKDVSSNIPLGSKKNTPNSKWGSYKWGKNVFGLGKYNAKPHLFWAKVKLTLDFGVLFQVNYTIS